MTTLIKQRRLKLFVQAEDHSLASVNPAPSNWRWPRGCPHHTPQRTIIETPQAWSRLSLQQSSARSSFMAQDRGNSYDHTVGVPPDDDDTIDTATDFNNIAILVHRQSMQQGSAHNAFISAGNYTSSGRLSAGVPVSSIFLCASCSSGTSHLVVADLRLFM